MNYPKIHLLTKGMVPPAQHPPPAGAFLVLERLQIVAFAASPATA